MSLLLAYGADATQADARGLTPLLTAAWQGQRAAVEALLEWHRKKKEEVEQRGVRGETIEARLNQQMLSSFPYSAPHEGHLVETHGQKRGRESSFPSLPPLSLLLSQTDGRGRSALYLSAAYGHNAVVSLLLAMGADPRVRSKEGKTARDKAEARGEKEVAGLLKQYEEEPGRIRMLCGMRAREGRRREIDGDVGVKNTVVENQQLQQHHDHLEEVEEEEEAEEKKEEEEKEDMNGVGEAESTFDCRRRRRREWWRGWRQVVGAERGVQDGKEEEEDEDGEVDNEEREDEEEDEEDGNVYGAVSQPWSWRVWRRRGVKVGEEEGRKEGQRESPEQYSECKRVGKVINQGSKKGEVENLLIMEKVNEVARLVVATLPDDLFVELAGFMKLPWDKDEEDLGRGQRTEGAGE